MTPAKLLIVDDEKDLLAELQPLLERSGYTIVVAPDGAAALPVIVREKPDLIILDMLMPNLDGRGVLRHLRQADDWTPIILLTQVTAPSERVLSLQEGADDYLNKPFDPLELLARIQAVLRRTQRTASKTGQARYLTAAQLRLDRQTRQASFSGTLLNLTARAFGVLEYLMRNPHEVVPRDRLLDDVWGWSTAVGTRAVDIRIAEIRKALNDDSQAPRFIETVVGQGYRFLMDVEQT